MFYTIHQNVCNHTQKTKRKDCTEMKNGSIVLNTFIVFRP